jgi:hypothetical protein
MTHAIFVQSTGELIVQTPRPLTFHGYAGRGIGRNNPDCQSIQNVGPLPRNMYAVSAPFDSGSHGPVCFRLTPVGGGSMYGRSGFLIHGDNVRGDASKGCIIMHRPCRDFLARHRVTTLEVVRSRSKVAIAA